MMINGTVFGRAYTLMVNPEKGMARDWAAAITVQEKIANIKMKIVTAVLADEAADLDMVSELYRDLEVKAKRFDALFLEMLDELELDHHLIHTALTLEDMWARMSVTVSHRVRTMQGLPSVGSQRDG
jgi:hypothetical protein